MITMSPLAGLMANCTLDPPVSTPNAADTRKRRVAHALILDIGQRLNRSDGNPITGVHTREVEVLDRTNDDAVVGLVPHDLEFVLLPSGDGGLDEDLADGTGFETLGGDVAEAFFRGSCAMPVPAPPRM